MWGELRRIRGGWLAGSWRGGARGARPSGGGAAGHPPFAHLRSASCSSVQDRGSTPTRAEVGKPVACGRRAAPAAWWPMAGAPPPRLGSPPHRPESWAPGCAALPKPAPPWRGLGLRVHARPGGWWLAFGLGNWYSRSPPVATRHRSRSFLRAQSKTRPAAPPAQPGLAWPCLAALRGLPRTINHGSDQGPLPG